MFDSTFHPKDLDKWIPQIPVEPPSNFTRKRIKEIWFVSIPAEDIRLNLSFQLVFADGKLILLLVYPQLWL